MRPGRHELVAALRFGAWIAEAVARQVADEVQWWRDARAAKREYIAGLSNAELDRRLRGRE